MMMIFTFFHCISRISQWSASTFLGLGITVSITYTVPKEIDFPRYNMKCSGENVILRGIFRVLSCFPLHFLLYRGNFDCFSNRVTGPHRNVRSIVIPKNAELSVMHKSWFKGREMLTAVLPSQIILVDSCSGSESQNFYSKTQLQVLKQ